MASGKEKRVLITGADGGIGRAAALRFAKAGWGLIITYRSSEAEGRSAIEECLAEGAAFADLLRLDLQDDASIRSAAETLKRTRGAIDVLVNNAGVVTYKPLAEQTFEEISSQVRINLEGLIEMTAACLPMVRERILNISSPAGFRGYPRISVYSATKAGIGAFTKSLAEELTGVEVLTVYPGGTATKMNQHHGVDPSIPAEIIYDAAVGAFDVSSGSDILVSAPPRRKARPSVGSAAVPVA
jgi:NAD(P)-dependent dehydrogenase (short-subunit alcohol dehydrogenase family)